MIEAKQTSGVVDILTLIANSNKPLSAIEISGRLSNDISVKTYRRIINELFRSGYLAKDENKYILGPMLIGLGAAALEKNVAARSLIEITDRYADTTNCRVVIQYIIEDDVVVIYQKDKNGVYNQGAGLYCRSPMRVPYCVHQVDKTNGVPLSIWLKKIRHK